MKDIIADSAAPRNFQSFLQSIKNCLSVIVSLSKVITVISPNMSIIPFELVQFVTLSIYFQSVFYVILLDSLKVCVFLSVSFCVSI